MPYLAQVWSCLVLVKAQCSPVIKVHAALSRVKWSSILQSTSRNPKSIREMKWQGSQLHLLCHLSTLPNDQLNSTGLLTTSTATSISKASLSSDHTFTAAFCSAHSSWSRLAGFSTHSQLLMWLGINCAPLTFAQMSSDNRMSRHKARQQQSS